ncbi:hypothetical protein OF83DRAFT_1066876 [Amylostereum chailletii]|nr:hypothetical protein OF83DRAFT_1066876 [Amylostereum chailletii]
MTVFPRFLAILAIAASVLPSVAATASCGSNQFLYKDKDCCVDNNGPKGSPPAPPYATTCPTTNWYWHDTHNFCVPRNSPPDNSTPSCPKNHGWNGSNSYCTPTTTPSQPGGQGDCDSSEFFWSGPKGGCCLPHGGAPPAQPPSGNQCPTSGWYWNKDQGCCTPHHPSPPAPSCPSSWGWNSGSSCCQPTTPTNPGYPQPSKGYGYHNKHNKKRSASLCPAEHEACPVVGSLGLTSDYECINTSVELESCGGCSSVQPERDCTRIEGAWNVGCETGACKVYSCMLGYKVSDDHSSCVAL